MISLWEDQCRLVDKVRAKMRVSKSVLLVSPTGSGKTRIAAHMIEAAKNRNRKILFSVPRRDLMEQTSESFSELGIDHSFVAAGKPHNPFSDVYIGMVDTMARRIHKLPKVDLLIPDETRFGDKALGSVINHYKQIGSWVLGLDASPWKSSGKGLGCWYDSMVEGETVRWLIDNKRLSDYRYFHGRSKLDLSHVKVIAGEYSKKDLSGYMEEQGGAIIGDCVRDYKERCNNSIHAVRCASIKHSEVTAQAFRDAGIPAMHIDGETPMDERKTIFRALARRELLVICFCSLLEFGFDLSQASGGMDVCIESGSDQKPCMSLASHVQWLGRLMRYHRNKPYATINDHVNNYIEHGFPDDEREWTLEDRDQGKRASSERVSSIRQCTGGHRDGPLLGNIMPPCYTPHRPAPRCPSCGAWYEIKSRDIEELDGELVELTKEQREAIKLKRIANNKAAQAMAKSLDELIALAKARGYKNPYAWASHIVTARAAKR